MIYNPDESEKTIQVLEQMKAVLYEGGWRQHSAGGLVQGRPTCLMGSYAIANGYIPNWNKVNVALGIRELIQVCGSGSLTHWNDAEGRTFTEVIDAIDQAILLVKERS